MTKKPPESYLNRELSLLDFQERVLSLAERDDLPLLERVKFVAIVGSNLDEFFQVRVGTPRISTSSISKGAPAPVSALVTSARDWLMWFSPCGR